MCNTISRKFLILIGPYEGHIGTLVGEISYKGCTTGWHTILLPCGEQGLYAGNELEALRRVHLETQQSIDPWPGADKN